MRTVLWIGGLGICPSAASWLVSNDDEWLFAAQLLGGVAWAAYELATFLAFFDHIERRERIRVLTTYDAASAFAITVGSIGGGLLLGALGSDAGAYAALYAALYAGSTVPAPRGIGHPSG